MSAEEVTYLISSQTSNQDIVYGTAITDSDQYEVYGIVKVGLDSISEFAGMWTRAGKIQAVDKQGNMYLFKVIHVVTDTQSIEFIQTH